MATGISKTLVETGCSVSKKRVCYTWQNLVGTSPHVPMRSDGPVCSAVSEAYRLDCSAS